MLFRQGQGRWNAGFSRSWRSCCLACVGRCLGSSSISGKVSSCDLPPRTIIDVHIISAGGCRVSYRCTCVLDQGLTADLESQPRRCARQLSRSLVSTDHSSVDACRVLGIGPISYRLSFRNQELDIVGLPRSRQWLREIELHPPLVRARALHRRHCARRAVDPKPPSVWPSYPRAAKGGNWCGCLRHPLRYHPDIAQACATNVPPVLLHRSVSRTRSIVST